MGNFGLRPVPGSTSDRSPMSPETLLGGQAQAKGIDPARDQLRTLTSQTASLQQQFMELFEQYPSTAKYLRQLQDAVRGALMAATQTLTQGQQGPNPPMIG